jgi:hypothetical protein
MAAHAKNVCGTPEICPKTEFNTKFEDFCTEIPSKEYFCLEYETKFK